MEEPNSQKDIEKIATFIQDQVPANIDKPYEEKRANKNNHAFYLAVNHSSTDGWYINQPLGNNSLAAMMKEAAGITGLEGNNYTNHSGRKTGVQRLLDSNVAPYFITQLTSHKNVASLSSFSEADTKMQKRMSAMVAGERAIQEPVGHQLPREELGSSYRSMSAGASVFHGSFSNCTFSVYTNSTESDRRQQ